MYASKGAKEPSRSNFKQETDLSHSFWWVWVVHWLLDVRSEFPFLSAHFILVHHGGTFHCTEGSPESFIQCVHLLSAASETELTKTASCGENAAMLEFRESILASSVMPKGFPRAVWIPSTFYLICSRKADKSEINLLLSKWGLSKGLLYLISLFYKLPNKLPDPDTFWLLFVSSEQGPLFT